MLKFKINIFIRQKTTAIAEKKTLCCWKHRRQVTCDPFKLVANNVLKSLFRLENEQTNERLKKNSIWQKCCRHVKGM